MKEKLLRLYNECLQELQSIGINCEDKEIVGDIDIKISKRTAKRYGCCKQEEPDIRSKYRDNGRIKYNKFNKHHIEISKWVLDLNDDIIKNTIIHEIIHCMPFCNNHGKIFKQYARLVNEKLGYNISRLGNKEADYKKSNLLFEEKKVNYKYKIICTKCGQVYFRQRYKKNMIKLYRCGICKGMLKLENI